MGSSLVRLGYGITVLFFVFFLLLFPRGVFAGDDYVLPYPSEMPGSKTYFLHKLQERISKYWYIGDYGRFTYNRQLADKYLVEAKTLFAYKQYALGLQALSTSNHYFKQMVVSLGNTPDSKYGRGEKIALMKQAAGKHLEELQVLLTQLPGSFLWQEEKESAKILSLSMEIQAAISIRKEAL